MVLEALIQRLREFGDGGRVGGRGRLPSPCPSVAVGMRIAAHPPRRSEANSGRQAARCPHQTAVPDGRGRVRMPEVAAAAVLAARQSR